MKSLLSLFSFCLLCISGMAQSGMPYCIWEDQNAGLYHFCRHNAANGNLNTIATIPGLDAFVAGTNATYAADMDQYHFTGLDGGSVRLYTIDVLTGSVLFSPAISDNIVGVRASCAGDTLFALREINDNYDLIKIEPMTGLITSIAALSNIDAYIGETFTLDQKRGLYSFVALDGGQTKLRAYDVSNGSLVHDHSFPDNLTAFQYNCSDSSIYALWENGNYKLEKVDIISGSHATAVDLNGVTPGYVFESSSMEVSGVYTYRGFNANNDFAMISVDLALMSVIHNTATNDNAKGFAENMCCSTPPLNMEEVLEQPEFNVYPNPTSESCMINSDQAFRYMSIKDLTGRVIQEIDLQHPTNEARFAVDGISPGKYLLIIGDKRIDKRSSLLIVN